MGMQRTVITIASHCSKPDVSLNRLNTIKTNEQLENEITTLAANINAATYRLLVLIAEFDKRSAWEGDGYRSCAHWLNVRCGIGLPAARDRVRVALTLEALPKISAAFEEGKLSFSKAREMTRVANAANEDYLLMIAEHGSAQHVAELVRKYRSVERREACESAMSQQAERALAYYWDDDGFLKIEACLPAEQGAVILKALQSALEQVEFVDASAEEADNLTTNTPDTGENATAVAHLLEERRKKQVNGPQQRADALLLLAERYLQTPANNETAPECKTADRYQVMVHVDVETLMDSVEEPTVPLEHRHCEIEHGPALARDSIRRLCCDSGVLAIHKDAQGNPLNIGRKTRAIPPAMRRALKVRDEGCTFPGCTCKRYVDGHHIQHWADGGETSLDNLTLLCRHHHRLVHEGGFGVARALGGRLVFIRPDGKVLDTAAVPRSAAQWVEEINENNRIYIDHETVYRQRDRFIDYGMAVDGLIQQRVDGISVAVT